LIPLHVFRRASVDAARTTVRAWLRAVGGVGAVQPEHVGIVVIPQRHDENHASIDGLLHGIQASLLQEIRAILGNGNPVCAEVVSDGVVLLSVDRVRWVLNGPAILLVELLHLNKLTVVGAIVGDELRGHRDGLGAVNLEVGAWAEEIVGAQPVRLDVTTVLVAQAAEAVLAIVAAINTLAAICSPGEQECMV